MNYTLEDVPADMADVVEEWREKLIETAVEQDDDLMEAYLEGEEPSIEDLKKCIRKGHHRTGLLPNLLWLFIQEQRCSIGSGCCG